MSKFPPLKKIAIHKISGSRNLSFHFIQNVKLLTLVPQKFELVRCNLKIHNLKFCDNSLITQTSDYQENVLFRYFSASGLNNHPYSGRIKWWELQLHTFTYEGQTCVPAIRGVYHYRSKRRRSLPPHPPVGFKPRRDGARFTAVRGFQVGVSAYCKTCCQHGEDKSR